MKLVSRGSSPLSRGSEETPKCGRAARPTGKRSSSVFTSGVGDGERHEAAVLLEWTGYMGKRGAAAIENLEQLPRRQGSDLDNQIQDALTRIKEPRRGAMPGSQIDRP